MSDWLAFLMPWELWPVAIGLAALLAVGYARGVVRMREAARPVGLARATAFYLGLLLVYAVMQTHYDYLAQHMFFVHRIQHLVLHHVGPFLIALAQPQEALAQGLPRWLVRDLLTPLWRNRITQAGYRLLQNAVVAPVLFVGLIYLWLLPSLHFDAMLSGALYRVMNWSMLLDGLLFWFLMLDPRTRAQGALLGYGTRMLIVVLAVVPQIYIGAHLALSHVSLYEVYGACGRAWDLDPIADQEVGGIVTWIPAGMMHLVGALILLGYWMRADGEAASAPSLQRGAGA
jgi:putative membrane protein